MTKNQEVILARIRQYLDANPSIRFGQALFNLKILEQIGSPDSDGVFPIRDIHADTDQDIVTRTNKPL